MKEPNHSYIAGLVTLAQQGSSDAFAELYAMTYNKTYNYARHYLKDDYLAQDALQEIYISALRNIQKINDPTLFIAWLNRISFNICYDISTKNKSVSFVDSPEVWEFIGDDNLSLNPEIQTQHTDELRRLHNAIKALPFHERQVITMRFFNDLKLEDIASALNISRSSVKRHIASAKKNLLLMMKG